MYKICSCDDIKTSVAVNRVRKIGQKYQVCMTKQTANDIVEGGVVAAFAAPAVFLMLPGGAAFVLIMVGWAVKKWGVGNVPAFCVEFTPPHSVMVGMAPMMLPLQVHSIWEQ